MQANLEAQYTNQEFQGFPKEDLSVAQHKLLEWTAKGSWEISCRKMRAELLSAESGSVERSSWKPRESGKRQGEQVSRWRQDIYQKFKVILQYTD